MVDPLHIGWNFIGAMDIYTNESAAFAQNNLSFIIFYRYIFVNFNSFFIYEIIRVAR